MSGLGPERYPYRGVRVDYTPPAQIERTASQKHELTALSVDKREAAKRALKLWKALVKYVMTRDGRRCRICGGRQKLDPHHVIWKSAGGEDSKENVCAACRWCHDAIHLHQIDVSGNAEKKLRIQRRR